jgi:hypothetical protein
MLTSAIYIALAVVSALTFPVDSWGQSRERGLELQIGYGMANFHNEGMWNYPDETAKDGQLTSIGLGYDYNIGQLSLTGHIFALFGPTDSGSYSQYNTIYRTQNIWGAVIRPGYRINSDTAVYSNFGYASATTSHEDNNGSEDYGTTTGPLFGFGIKTNLDKNTAFGFEAYRISFQRSQSVYSTGWSTYTTNKPNLTYAGLYLSKYFSF